jgi:hypothetical protein
MNARVCQNGDEELVGRSVGDDRGIFASLTVFGPAARFCQQTHFLLLVFQLSAPGLKATLLVTLVEALKNGSASWVRLAN